MSVRVSLKEDHAYMGHAVRTGESQTERKAGAKGSNVAIAYRIAARCRRVDPTPKLHSPDGGL